MSVKARSSQVQLSSILLYHTTLALWLFLNDDVFHLPGLVGLSHHAALYFDRTRRALVILDISVRAALLSCGCVRLLGRLGDRFAAWSRETAIHLVVRQVSVSRCGRDRLSILDQLHDLVCLTAKVAAGSEWVIPTALRTKTDTENFVCQYLIH